MATDGLAQPACQRPRIFVRRLGGQLFYERAEYLFKLSSLKITTRG